MELWQRLETVRQTAGWSGREFSRRAGLRSESHYTILISALRRGKNILSATLEALVNAAAEAGYDRNWILTGDGLPRPRTLASVPAPIAKPRRETPAPGSVRRFNDSDARKQFVLLNPNRARAEELLCARGLDPATVAEQLALAAVDAGLDVAADPPVAWWIDRYREALLKSANAQSYDAAKKR